MTADRGPKAPDSPAALGLPLSTLSVGVRGTVRALLGGRSFCSRVANLGFTSGAEVKVIQNYGHGPIIVSVRGTRVALGRPEAALVLVDAEASAPG